jgi:hypothetical protein
MAIGFNQYPAVGDRIPNLQVVPDITLPASSVQQQVPFVMNGGPVCIVGLAAKSTAAFTSRIELTWEQTYCDTGEVRSTSLWGTATSPTWVRPKHVPDRNLVTNATNTVQLMLFCVNGLDGDDALYGRGKGFMVYVLPNDAGMVVPASGTLQFTQQAEAWADFAPDAMVMESTSPSFSINYEFRDSRADFNYQLCNLRTPGANLFGTPAGSGTDIKPWQFPDGGQPVFRKNSNLTYDAFDTSGSANTLRPCQIGQRLT